MDFPTAVRAVEASQLQHTRNTQHLERLIALHERGTGTLGGFDRRIANLEQVTHDLRLRLNGIPNHP